MRGSRRFAPRRKSSMLMASFAGMLPLIRRQGKLAAFVPEQPRRARHSAAVPDELAVRADNAVTGHADGDGIGAVRQTDRARTVAKADARGKLTVGHRGARFDFAQ